MGVHSTRVDSLQILTCLSRDYGVLKGGLKAPTKALLWTTIVAVAVMDRSYKSGSGLSSPYGQHCWPPTSAPSADHAAMHHGVTKELLSSLLRRVKQHFYSD
jgi:hypothetical protein